MVNVIKLDINDGVSSVAEVTIDQQVVEVKFWGSYTKQLSNNEELEAYLIAEANKKIGDIITAKATLSAYADGENNEEQETVEIEGRPSTITTGSDNRNWAKIWIDKN